jgi:hypothetical protein
MSWTVDRAATALLEAEDSRRGLSPNGGDQLVGVKLGLTSRAKQQRMNISSRPARSWPPTSPISARCSCPEVALP